MRYRCRRRPRNDVKGEKGKRGVGQKDVAWTSQSSSAAWSSVDVDLHSHFRRSIARGSEPAKSLKPLCLSWLQARARRFEYNVAKGEERGSSTKEGRVQLSEYFWTINQTTDGSSSTRGHASGHTSTE